MDIEDFFGITYQLEKVDGINQYCSYYNYGPSKRDQILSTEQWVMFKDSCCGAHYTLIQKSGHMVIKNSYRARPSLRELSISNGFCKSSIEISGNKIIHKQKGKREIEYIWELSRTQLIKTKTVDNKVTLIMYYRAIDEFINGMY